MHRFLRQRFWSQTQQVLFCGDGGRKMSKESEGGKCQGRVRKKNVKGEGGTKMSKEGEVEKCQRRGRNKNAKGE